VIGNRVKKRGDRRSGDWLPNHLRQKMKAGIHPDYREVVFHDLSCDFKFVTRSTVQTREKIEFEGKEYPLVKIEVSSESHPFYTGKHKIVDTAGRVEKFRQKFGKVGSKTQVAE
jgi:large subunit ribosomal protein L31